MIVQCLVAVSSKLPLDAAMACKSKEKHWKQTRGLVPHNIDLWLVYFYENDAVYGQVCVTLIFSAFIVPDDRLDRCVAGKTKPFE